MSSRNRVLLMLLGGLLVLALVGLGYFFGVDPYLKHKKDVEAAEAKAQRQEDDLEQMKQETKRLKELQKRSLPADPEAARAEYKLALEKLLRDSGAHEYTVNYIDSESNSVRGIPLVDPSAPKPSRDAKPADYLAYTQLVYKIEIPKTDLLTVAEVLRRYYALGLLHQITHLEIRDTSSAKLTEDKRGVKERTDLKVDITTKAITVNGAPARRSLLSAPPVYGGLVGGGGMASFEQTPAAARQADTVPDSLVHWLANPTREYDLVAAKDLYHGTLPPPPLPTGTLSGSVFEDANNDGVFDQTEYGVAGASVTLTQVVNGKSVPVGKTTTDQFGGYRFSVQNPGGGGYVVRVSPPSTHTIAKSWVGSTGGSNEMNDELTGISVTRDGESKNNNFTALAAASAKPDYREFIQYTTSIHTIEGEEHTITATLRDKINKEDYELIVTQVGEKVRVKVYKWEYQDYKADASQRKKKVYSQETLEISKYTMSNKNDFTVYGVDTDGSLILGERPAAVLPELPKDDKTPARPGGGGGRPAAKPVMPPPDPKAAVIGGVVVTTPKAEKFYRWKSGDSLKQIVELSKGEAEKAIRRVQTRFLPGGSGVSTIPPDGKGTETKDGR